MLTNLSEFCCQGSALNVFGLLIKVFSHFDCPTDHVKESYGCLITLFLEQYYLRLASYVR